MLFPDHAPTQEDGIEKQLSETASDALARPQDSIIDIIDSCDSKNMVAPCPLEKTKMLSKSGDITFEVIRYSHMYVNVACYRTKILEIGQCVADLNPHVAVFVETQGRNPGEIPPLPGMTAVHDVRGANQTRPGQGGLPLW